MCAKASVEENVDIKTLRDILDKKGPTAVEEYLKNNKDRWKKENVKFAVTGRSATGKSSFINKMRNVKPNDKGFASSGSGNTTQNIAHYEYPSNKHIALYDLPGVGSLQFPKDEYIKKMKIHEYDYFFIFLDKVVSEDDYWLARQLKSIGKPFCLVRSKIDEDVRNAFHDGKIESEVIPQIRENIRNEHSKYEELKTKIFLISSRDETMGDWECMVNDIAENFSSVKFDTMIYALPILSKEIIEKKYKELRKRLIGASVSAAAVAAVPIPGVDVAANIAFIVEEILHYISVFGLSKKKLETLSGFDIDSLKCYEIITPGFNMAAYVAAHLGKYGTMYVAFSVMDIFLPIVGSLISASVTGPAIYNFLSASLDNIKEDAEIVYKFIERRVKTLV